VAIWGISKSNHKGHEEHEEKEEDELERGVHANAVLADFTVLSKTQPLGFGQLPSSGAA
jgi:hypothetical protein